MKVYEIVTLSLKIFLRYFCFIQFIYKTSRIFYAKYNFCTLLWRVPFLILNLSEQYWIQFSKSFMKLSQKLRTWENCKRKAYCVTQEIHLLHITQLTRQTLALIGLILQNINSKTACCTLQPISASVSQVSRVIWSVSSCTFKAHPHTARC